MKQRVRCRAVVITAVISGLITTMLQAYADGGAVLWANQYGSGQSGDLPNAIAVDDRGTVFVTGSSANTNIYNQCATVAYSTAGAALWTNIYTAGTAYNQATGLAVDRSGNVFVTGYSDYPTADGSYLWFWTIKYSGTGVPLWTNLYTGPYGFDSSSALAVDSNGDVLVAGTSETARGNYDFITIKYSGSGSPLWTNLYDWLGNNGAKSVAVDKNGNVFVTGDSWNGSNFDFATVAYSAAGSALWTNRYNGADDRLDSVGGIAVDGNGNVFVSGQSYNRSNSFYAATVAYSGIGVPLWTNFCLDTGGGGIVVDRNGNVFVAGASFGTVAYSGLGVPLWTNIYIPSTANSFARANAIAMDTLGNVFLAGVSVTRSNNVSGPAGPPSVQLITTLAYSRAGVPLWTNLFGTGGATAAAVDKNGNLIVTGEAGALYQTIKYSSTGFGLLHIGRSQNQIVLSWTNSAFLLQTAPTVQSAFTNISGATSPYTATVTAPQQFFRLQPP